MDEVTRRSLLKAVAVVGTSATVAAALPSAVAGQSPGQESGTVTDPYHWSDAEKKDRQSCIDAGFTEDEADCWELFVRAGGKFLSLPELHPSTRGEFAQALHVIQDKLMTRPAYRKYREVAASGR